MRRSSSSSQIPLRSRSSFRSSVDRGEKRARSGSIDTARNVGISTKKSGLLFPRKQSVASTPKVGLFSASKKPGSASRLPTPMSAGSRSRSPYKTNINDKKWVSQQYIKVMQYMSEMYFVNQEQVLELKPPTLQSFAYVMNILLKEIDPRVEITASNYKEIVFNMLKALRYPGSISNSLLKTVNTMHAWPQVMAILSWLVDLVTLIKGVEEPLGNKVDDFNFQRNDCILDYLVRRYTLYNNNETQEMADEEFRTTFCQVLNIDENELQQQRDVVVELGERKERQIQEIHILEADTKNISQEIGAKRKEIDTYYNNNELEMSELDKKIAEEEFKLKKLQESNALKKQLNDKLRQTISKQKYTVEDKKKMLGRIDSLKHTNGLMENRYELRRKMKIEYEQKNAEMRKEVENEVYRFNNSLLPLVVVDQRLQRFEVKCKSFSKITPEFASILEKLSVDMKTFETRTNDTIKSLRLALQTIEKQNAELKQKIALFEEEINDLKNNDCLVQDKINDCKRKCGELQSQREKENKQFEQDIKLLNEDSDIDQLRKALLQTKARALTKERQLDNIKEEIVAFFIKIREKSLTNAQSVVQIYNRVVQKIEDSLEQINEIEAEVEKDMFKLEEVRKRS